MAQREKHWGIVTDNDDPQKRGRLTIQCDTVAEGDVLEWIEPSFHFTDSGQDIKAGAFWVPNPGTIVEVEVESSDDGLQSNDLDPRWKCCLYPDNAVPDVFKENYPQRRGWVTRAGHILYFDDTRDNFSFYYEHPSGTKITVDNDGNIRLDTDQSVYVGRDADESIPLGDTLKDLLSDMKIAFDTHTHACPAGTSDPPDPSFPTVTDAILSENHKVK